MDDPHTFHRHWPTGIEPNYRFSYSGAHETHILMYSTCTTRVWYLYVNDGSSAQTEAALRNFQLSRIELVLCIVFSYFCWLIIEMQSLAQGHRATLSGEAATNWCSRAKRRRRGLDVIVRLLCELQRGQRGDHESTGFQVTHRSFFLLIFLFFFFYLFNS